jgi:hypothetical protein
MTFPSFQTGAVRDQEAPGAPGVHNAILPEEWRMEQSSVLEKE